MGDIITNTKRNNVLHQFV